MKIQMIVLANSEEQRGRLLAGVLLEGGKMRVVGDGPQWICLRIRPDKLYIPKGLVVDLQPLDVIEVCVEAAPVWDGDCKWVTVDVSTLQVRGRMALDELGALCECDKLHAGSLIEEPGAAFSGTYCLVVGSRCSVDARGRRSGVQPTQLRFGFRGTSLTLPLHDSGLLEAQAFGLDVLSDRPSHRILVETGPHLGGKPRVLTVFH